MEKQKLTFQGIGAGIIFLISALLWRMYYIRGKKFALRDPLQKADAIVVLAGTRGNINYLEGKIQTGVKLYQQGWAAKIIFSGRFSVKVTNSPQLIPHEELVLAASQGRIQTKDIDNAAKTWDEGLGAQYMHDTAIELGIPEQDIIIEDISLHTRENAEQVHKILQANDMKKIILVTSPFHQLRTYLTFTKILQTYNIDIINYYADTGEWQPMTWFFNAEHRQLVKSEIERIKIYREKGDLL